MQVNTHENNIVHKIAICTVWQKHYYKHINAHENDTVMYILQRLLLLIKVKFVFIRSNTLNMCSPVIYYLIIGGKYHIQQYITAFS